MKYHYRNQFSKINISKPYKTSSSKQKLICFSFSDDDDDSITTFVPTFKKSKEEFTFSLPQPELPSLNEQTVNNPNLFEKTMVSQQKVPKYNGSEPFCQIYTGSTCKQFFENHFVFIQPPFTQQIIEEKLSEAVVVVSQSKYCFLVVFETSLHSKLFLVTYQQVAAISLCQVSAFRLSRSVPITYASTPISNNTSTNCTGNSKKNRSKRSERSLLFPCKESARRIATSWKTSCAAENMPLQNDILLLVKLTRIFIVFTNSFLFSVTGPVLELEECEYLPDETENTALSCLKLGVDRSRNVDKDDTCFWDNGELYRGVQDSSVSGLTCIRWSHQFQIPLSDNPELTGHSYCRYINHVFKYL